MALHVVIGAAFGLLTGFEKGYLWTNRRGLFWLSLAVTLVLVWLYQRTLVAELPDPDYLLAFFLAYFPVDLIAAALIRKRVRSSHS